MDWCLPGLYLKLNATKTLTAVTVNDASAISALCFTRCNSDPEMSVHPTSLRSRCLEIPITIDAKTTLSAPKIIFVSDDAV